MKNIKKMKRGRTQYKKGDNHYMMYKRKYILIYKNYYVLANLAVKNGLSLIFKKIHIHLYFIARKHL